MQPCPCTIFTAKWTHQLWRYKIQIKKFISNVCKILSSNRCTDACRLFSASMYMTSMALHWPNVCTTAEASILSLHRLLSVTLNGVKTSNIHQFYLPIAHVIKSLCADNTLHYFLPSRVRSTSIKMRNKWWHAQDCPCSSVSRKYT